VLAVNKVDTIKIEPEIYEFYNLGLGDPFPVSGQTGLGTGDLLDMIVEKLPPTDESSPEEDTSLKIAVIGRPNVGKSSLVNAITGKKTVIVSDIPGTTRDSVDTRLTFHGRNVLLVDTAGMKRITKLKESLEYFSSIRTLRSLTRCDVAIIVLDINEGLTSYDKSLIDDAEKAGKGIIIAANKWDLIEKDSNTSKQFEENIRHELPDKLEYPIVFISALNGQRVRKVLELAERIDAARTFRVSTADFNKFIETLPVPPGAGDISLRYGTQHAIEPPSFVIFVNDPQKVKDNFVRYMEKKIRDEYKLEGTPIRLTFKK
jgi:GTP-binding protein